jgi:hypothetical protein
MQDMLERLGGLSVTKEATVQVHSGSLLICDPCRLRGYGDWLLKFYEKRSIILSQEMTEYGRQMDRTAKRWREHNACLQTALSIWEKGSKLPEKLKKALRNYGKQNLDSPSRDEYARRARERLGPWPTPPYLIQGKRGVYAQTEDDGTYTVYKVRNGLVIPGGSKVNGEKVGEFFLDTATVALVDGSLGLEPLSPEIETEDKARLRCCKTISCELSVPVGKYVCKFGKIDPEANGSERLWSRSLHIEPRKK